MQKLITVVAAVTVVVVLQWLE